MSNFFNGISNICTFNIPSSSNQDRGKLWKKNGVIFVVVCDGHGDDGHDYANFCVNFLYDKFSLVDFHNEDLTETINDIIDNLEDECKKEIGNLNGGTTLSLIIQTENFNWIQR